MKKICYWISVLTLLLITPSLASAQPPAMTYKIGGTITIDGTAMTQGSFSGYFIKVTKDGGTALNPVAETTSLLSSGAYLIDIPVYDANYVGAATVGETLEIHLYQDSKEITVTTPANAEITMAEGGTTNYTIDLVAFAPKILTIAASDYGSTTPTEGEHTFAYGEEVPLTATPASSLYLFSSWEGGVEDQNSATTTITMNADKSISAAYTECNNILTMAVNDAQWGSVTLPSTGVGESSRGCGTNVTITAEPEAGYIFTGWTGDTVANSTTASTTVTMNDDKSVIANFTAITYTLTIGESANGSVDLSPAAQGNVYGEETVVTVTATPATGYLFSGWTGDVVNPNLASTTVIVDEDKTISANFIGCIKTLTMAVNDTQMGSTSPAVGENPQSCDASVSITATPASGYTFVNWTGDTIANANSATTTITMDEAKAVIANFVLTTYVLTIGTDDNGAVTATPETVDNIYGEGAVVTLTATPETGWAFSSWTGDVANTHLATTTVTMDEDQTVTPVFLSDSDNDGIDDTEEYGPNGDDTQYDGNNDTEPDYNQAHVTSVHNTNGTYYVTIETDAANTITSAAPIASPDPDNEPSGITMDYGYFNIDVSGLTAGGATTVTITLPDDAPVPGTYYKYGKTPDNPTTDHWYEFLYDPETETGAEFEGNVITLYFVDGLRGDSGLNATDGIIDDPGAPGRVTPVTAESDSCFIATAAYGSKMETHVQILRDFRDRYMLTNKMGRTFVDLYYKHSPRAANVIAKHDTLRTVIKYSLLPAVGASWLMLNFGALFTISFAAFLFLMIFGFVRYHRD